MLVLAAASLVSSFTLTADPRPADDRPVALAIPTAQTQLTPGSEDAADDPAVWINRANPELSLVIGTDKTAQHGGLGVYTLEGELLQFVQDGRMNNVDVRYGLPTGTGPIDIVVSTKRDDNSLAVYAVDAKQRRLRPVGARTIVTGLAEIYGVGLYHDLKNSRFFAFVNGKDGAVEQYLLTGTPDGRVDAERVRAFHVGTQPEGTVADDELGVVYIGEESVGVWKYPANPEDELKRSLVAVVAPHGKLSPDVEGLALALGPNGSGYLVVSSQGMDRFDVFERTGTNAYVGSFRLTSSGGIDETTHTDGICLAAVPLGPAFPGGVFVAQDDATPGGRQNFKIASWQEIERSIRDMVR